MDLNAFAEVTCYDPASGQIIGLRGGLLGDIVADGKAFVFGSGNEENQYVDTSATPPKLRARPIMPIVRHTKSISSDGERFMKFSGIPLGAKVEIAGESYVVEDGVFEWASPLPETYPVRIALFPYLDWQGEVIVVASTP